MGEIGNRARDTLQIVHDWGYAPTVEALAANLLGGAVPVPTLSFAIEGTRDIVMEDGFAFTKGRRDLLEKSRRRVETNRALNGTAKKVAEEFARDLARVCPLVDCVALSGSVASGGYQLHDDVDINLFVANDSKYIVYAMALLLGFRATLRHRKTHGLRKLICINVLWTRSQSQPFERRDERLAFELLQCRPLLGGEHFRHVIARNPWIDLFFPQLHTTPIGSAALPDPDSLGRVVAWVGRHGLLLRMLNHAARGATRIAYSFAHWWRRSDRMARERLRFLQRVKYPYEVFQD